MTTRIFRKVLTRRYSPDRHGRTRYVYRLSCGHTVLSSSVFWYGKLIICDACETPPQEGGKELGRPDASPPPSPPSAPSHRTARELIELLSWELRRLGVHEHIATTPKGIVCTTSFGQRVWPIPNPEQALESLKSIEVAEGTPLDVLTLLSSQREEAAR